MAIDHRPKTSIQDVLSRYERALRLIANNKHCMYYNNEASDYGKGVTDGHRYCAQIARDELGPCGNPPEEPK